MRTAPDPNEYWSPSAPAPASRGETTTCTVRFWLASSAWSTHWQTWWSDQFFFHALTRSICDILIERFAPRISSFFMMSEAPWKSVPVRQYLPSASIPVAALYSVSPAYGGCTTRSGKQS